MAHSRLFLSLSTRLQNNCHDKPGREGTIVKDSETNILGLLSTPIDGNLSLLELIRKVPISCEIKKKEKNGRTEPNRIQKIPPPPLVVDHSPFSFVLLAACDWLLVSKWLKCVLLISFFPLCLSGAFLRTWYHTWTSYSVYHLSIFC